MKFKYLLITLTVLIVDQLTKYWATVSLKPLAYIEVIPRFFRLTYATNRGVAFSMFADSELNVRLIFTVISTAAALLVVFYFKRTPVENGLMNTALSLLLAGIVGNLIDRVRFGEVVDFLDFHLAERFTWPTFNVADAAICIGAVLFALEMLREEKQSNLKPGISGGGAEEGHITSSE